MSTGSLSMELEPVRAGFSAARLERITTHLNRSYVEPGKIAGCQVLVARRGHVAYRKSLGLMDRERGVAMRDDAIFRIFSMTKPITSVALMTLFEQGLFQLSDPVHRIIPEWRDLKVYVSGEGASMETRRPSQPVTFRHLLSHTSGLTYGGVLPSERPHPVDALCRELQLSGNVRSDSKIDLATFVQRLAKVPLRFSPGDHWMYSLATDVCGHLVQAISGQRFDRYLQEHIFGPLGMVDTAFQLRPESSERFTACYQREADKRVTLNDDPYKSRFAPTPTFLSGGAGLLSTMEDYYRFCEMLRRGGDLAGARVLGPRTLALMTANHLPGGGDLSKHALGAFSETAYEGVGFGLGFASTVDPVASGSFGRGDYFWGGMASTIFWVDPSEDLIVIFLTQLIPSATFNFRAQLKSLIYSAIVD
jgi:CubicO group peptidase (beta-lactamase class C family)